MVPVSAYRPDEPGLSFFVGAEVVKALLNQDLGAWQPEEWLLRTVPSGLLLAGQDGTGNPWSASTPAGSMLAVYVLLDDHLGVRWFWPGPFGEHVPSRPDATLPEFDLRAAIIRQCIAQAFEFVPKMAASA